MTVSFHRLSSLKQERTQHYRFLAADRHCALLDGYWHDPEFGIGEQQSRLDGKFAVGDL